MSLDKPKETPYKSSILAGTPVGSRWPSGVSGVSPPYGATNIQPYYLLQQQGSDGTSAGGTILAGGSSASSTATSQGLPFSALANTRTSHGESSVAGAEIFRPFADESTVADRGGVSELSPLRLHDFAETTQKEQTDRAIATKILEKSHDDFGIRSNSAKRARYNWQK